ncbi:hypothetical protein [Pontibacter harenae]|uniref:hypothetical protein n=1 Tax=Pontibacter harenae TaxID=2894083 RepID=UPI001E30FD9F|nr:hypothetical protein [Pontibacter harenae]MCC9167920.1 hypothetical protein [Pontibacter harenae]
MKPAETTTQNQPYAVAVRIGELVKAAGTEAARERRALMKLLVELESKNLQLIESR